FFFSSRRRHTRSYGDWSSDVCSSDLLGVAAFGVASVLCAIAPNATSLIVFRGIQGVAGALLTPASLAVITSTFSGTERGAAIGRSEERRVGKEGRDGGWAEQDIIRDD